MMSFRLNGRTWRVQYVEPYDLRLVDRTGTLCVATTDPNVNVVYLSDELEGDFLVRVLVHEIGHCALVSFNLIDDIHRLCRPDRWMEAEEWICNFIADYGLYIFKAAYAVLGENAWIAVPYELERRAYSWRLT